MQNKTHLAGVLFTCVPLSGIAFAQGVFTKGQVADRIRKVEDGVDEFRKWSGESEASREIRQPRSQRRPSSRTPRRTDGDRVAENRGAMRRLTNWMMRSAI